MRRLVVLLGLMFVLSGCASHPPAPKTEGVGGEAALGIRVTALHLTAAGYMLDLRYRVIDPERARPVLDRAVKPYLIEERTGVQHFIPVSPKLGGLRQTSRRVDAGREYFVVFANPGRRLAAGDRVTVVFGEHRLTGIEVM